MSQEQATLPLDLPPLPNIEQVLGLTEWIHVKQATPPWIGWWKTRRSLCPDLLQPQRRWWNGYTFSKPVLMGPDEEFVEALQKQPSVFSDDIEWCGLKAPHPAGYSYQLVKSPRIQLIDQEKRNEAR